MKHLLKALRLTLVLLILCAGIYTIVVFSLAQLAPGKGKGIMVSANGKSYYANIGQSFTEDKYFNGRPSAVGYNAAGSGGSNKGPSNEDWLQQVEARIDSFLVHNPGIKRGQIPVELVTASGSGLDPDLSVKAAKVQVKRIARVRHLRESQLDQLVDKHTQGPLLGLFGPSKINVLELNLALDKLQ